MKSLGQRIRASRIYHGLSQNQLAEELGISEKTIMRYENNQSKPDTYSLVKMATFFDVSTDYLLGLASTKDGFREIKNKVLRDGSYTVFYNHYLFCKNNTEYDKNSDYYWIFATDNDIGGQTQWAGWLGNNGQIEVRVLRPVEPLLAIKNCRKLHEKPMLINNELDAAVFRMFGGQAIVKKEICETYLPEFMEKFIVSRRRQNAVPF